MPGSEEDGGERDNGSDAASPKPFADLLGDATPLGKGPKRAAPPPARNRPALRGASSPHGSPATVFRWPHPEDRSAACAEGVSDTQLFSLGRGEPEPEERIDLHGVRREAASRLLTKRLESAATQGLRCVLIIHGQGARSPVGEAVLRDALPDWLTRGRAARSVLAFTPAPDRLGGLGATLVLLRRK